MDAADILYGVSMGGDGVTKVVSACSPRDELGAGRASRPSPRNRGGRREATAAVATDWRDAFDLGDGAGSTEAPAEDRAGCSDAFARASRSRKLTAELSASFTERIDETTWERLEEALILADVGAKTTAQVVRRLEDEAEVEVTGGEALRERLIELLAETATPADGANPPGAPGRTDDRGRERDREDHDDREDRLAPAQGAGTGRDRRRRGYLPGGGGEPARGVGRSRRQPDRSWLGGR